VIRLDGVFSGQDINKIRLAEWDEHPNAYGHRLIADDLFSGLSSDSARIFGSGAIAADAAAIVP
jgi:hypothetical protein